MKNRLPIIIIGCAAILLPLLFLAFRMVAPDVSKPGASREGQVLSPIDLTSGEKIKIQYKSAGCRSWCSWYFELSGGDSARLVVIDAGESYDSGVSGPSVPSTVGVVELTKRERRGLRDLLEFYRDVFDQSLGTTENRISIEYFRGSEKVGSERFVEGGLAEYWVYRKDQPESYGEGFDPRVTPEMVSFRSLFLRAWREANKSLEPTPKSVMHPAAQAARQPWAWLSIKR